jgi:hypothetical protein
MHENNNNNNEKLIQDACKFIYSIDKKIKSITFNNNNNNSCCVIRSNYRNREEFELNENVVFKLIVCIYLFIYFIYSIY